MLRIQLKKITIIIIITMLTGCNSIDIIKESRNLEIREDNFEDIFLEKDEEIFLDYEKLLEEDSSSKKIYEYLVENIPKVSKLSSNIMIDKFIEYAICNEYLEHEKHLKSKNLEIESIEDQFESIYHEKIDYRQLYLDFGKYLSDDYKDYLELIEIELNEPISKEGALIVSWDELGERVILFEKYLEKYPIAENFDQIQDKYYYYMSSYLYGLNNTPVYEYSTGTLLENVKKSYERFIEKNQKSQTTIIINGYLGKLRENKWKVENTEVVNYLVEVYEILQTEN